MIDTLLMVLYFREYVTMDSALDVSSRYDEREYVTMDSALDFSSRYDDDDMSGLQLDKFPSLVTNTHEWDNSEMVSRPVMIKVYCKSCF